MSFITVAIVVAPTANPSIGIFRITDPPGLGIIGACDQKPTFHPHPEPKQGIYTDATAFHVKLQRGLRLDVVDGRR